MNETQLFYDSYLAHHGVKGMKWGRRRWQNADGSLTPAGVKRYAQKGYAQDSYNSNETVKGKIYDRYTGAHKVAAKGRYETSSEKQNRARAEKYLTDKNTKKLVEKQPKQRPSWKYETSERQKRWEDNHGINPNRPNGTTNSDIFVSRKKTGRTVKKGAAKTAEILSKVGTAYMTDQIFWGGNGTRIAMSAVKHTGRAVISAYIYARGGRDIRWYDN